MIIIKNFDKGNANENYYHFVGGTVDFEEEVFDFLGC